MYFADLAFVHNTGFGDLAAQTAPEIVRLLRAHRIGRGTIVELGCGSGITARYLTVAGFDIIGIDVSKAMIEIAQRTAPRARFRVASIAAAPLPDCRAVVAVGEVVSYLPGVGGAANLSPPAPRRPRLDDRLVCNVRSIAPYPDPQNHRPAPRRPPVQAERGNPPRADLQPA